MAMMMLRLLATSVYRCPTRSFQVCIIGSAYLFGKCPWELDGNGSVGTSDLLALFAQWGTAGPADFDGSGAVNTNDLLILFANWGPCP